MQSLILRMNFIRALMLPRKRNLYHIIIYTFLRYLNLRFRKLLWCTVNVTWNTLPDATLRYLANKYYRSDNTYFDCNSCVLGNLIDVKITTATWFYVCCIKSLKKYKILILPFKNVNENVIYLSESVRYNIENALSSSELKGRCFLIPISKNTIEFALGAEVSLISDSQDYAMDLIDTILENYFSEPRFLRIDDIIGINAKEYAPNLFYSSGNFMVYMLYFKVMDIKCQKKRNGNHNSGCYIVNGETTLILRNNVHNYLPSKDAYCTVDSNDQITVHSLILRTALGHLEDSILPFLREDDAVSLKPLFLLKGTEGCGKRKLVEICSKRLGFNLLNVDFGEIQSLTSAQTEAKLRILLQNAQRSMPCILCLNNIQVFGKNSEGQKDERIISAFSTEISALYEKHLKFPIIIIATLNSSNVAAELQRMFLDTISIDHLDRCERLNVISWTLSSKGLVCKADVTKVSDLCVDFKFSDLISLTLHATKVQYKRLMSTGTSRETILVEEDFVEAHEWIQSTYSDRTNVPRIPKTRWEDIGGLADLKCEIIHRMRLPLLDGFGFKQSGILLYGPPGTGKTLLAKAIATEYQLHFLSIKGPEVLNMYIGQSEKNVRQVFERARAAAPCVMFFDELDSLAPKRGKSGDSGGVMDRIVSQLLAEMDGLEGTSNIFIIAATNRPDLIDRALLRPGRFDKMLYVGAHTNRDAQLSVLKALTRKFHLSSEFAETGFEEFVKELPCHVTGADLYAICSDAWLSAVRTVISESYRAENDKPFPIGEECFSPEGIVTVDSRDFSMAMRTFVPSIDERDIERYTALCTELSSS